MGLAVGRALALCGLQVVVIERNRRAGEETSSRNSGVVHAGLYYPPGSLKARLCVAGRDQLYAHCQQFGVAHRRCGKLILAQGDQLAQLARLREQALANRVTDVRRLDAVEVRALEPSLRCAEALWLPATGIVDVPEFLLSLQGDMEAHEGLVVLDAELLDARARGRGIAANVRSGAAAGKFECRWLINCAGLQAAAVLERIQDYPQTPRRSVQFAKGNYFSCSAAPKWQRLIYPLPNEAGLGIHATIDLAGSVRFGPDVEWVTDLHYGVNPARAESFYAPIRQYWPDLPDGSLQPSYSGIRPKLVPQGAPAADFLIEGPTEHGVDGLINLLGIESPGLTASMAIGTEIVRRVGA